MEETAKRQPDPETCTLDSVTELVEEGQTSSSFCPEGIRGSWIVSGLHCGDCARRVEKVLSRVPGVLSATVGYPSGRLDLCYLPGATMEAVALRVHNLGYELEPRERLSSEAQDHAPSHTHEHDHEHEHSHSHTHAHDHRLAHHHHHSHGEASYLIPILSTVGIAIGFIASHMGAAWYHLPFVAAALLAGYPVAKAGLGALFAGAGADVNLLTAVAGTGALFLGQWAEAAAVLTLFAFGELLEAKAGERARKSIEDVMDLSPRIASVKRGGEVVEVHPDSLRPGDILVVAPGEMVAADGVVLTGESGVNEAPITGESIPVDKRPGDQVFAGSVNGEGPLLVTAERTAKDTTVSRIIAMVEDAQSKKARSERLVDSFAKYWTPSMIALSVLVALGPPLLAGAPYRQWIYRGLTVLIVSCPCSLVISTPVTVVAAIARAARSGVLVKGGVHLEDLAKVKAVAFDKTGTITQGLVAVHEVQTSDEFSREDVLAFAAGAESRSEHPLAKAVVLAAKESGIEVVDGRDFQSARGRGISAVVKDERVYVGSEKLLGEAGIEVPQDMAGKAQELRSLGRTAIFVGKGTQVIGVLGLADRVREEARASLESLRHAKVEAVMLTGDDVATAKAVAQAVGITDVRAGLLPQEKQEAVADLTREYGMVAMVGDGVNDAPSLAAAGVGIAMGGGTDVALETADVALLGNDLSRISWSLGLGRSARSLIVQNVGFSLALKIAALALVMSGYLPLWVAVLADSGAALIVTLNGLRILGYR